MRLEHLLQLLGVQRARTVVIELEEDILDVILGPQLRLRLDIELFGGVLVARHEPVLGGQSSHNVADIAVQIRTMRNYFLH